MAKIYLRAASSDKILILGTRESATQPFTAPSWTDIRAAFWISATQTANDDAPTALAETITSNATVPSNNFFIGIKDHSTDLPGLGQSSFIGYNSRGNVIGTPSVNMSSSDLGIGTTNAYFWRPNNGGNSNFAFGFVLGPIFRQSQDGIQMHVAQDIVNAGGYSNVIAFRVTRPNPTSRFMTVTVPHAAAHSSDIAWSNAPTLANLLNYLDPWPPLGLPVQTVGPLTIPSGLNLPDSLFAYWPFRNSRLRISAWGILKGGT